MITSEKILAKRTKIKIKKKLSCLFETNTTILGSAPVERRCAEQIFLPSHLAGCLIIDKQCKKLLLLTIVFLPNICLFKNLPRTREI